MENILQIVHKNKLDQKKKMVNTFSKGTFLTNYNHYECVLNKLTRNYVNTMTSYV